MQLTVVLVLSLLIASSCSLFCKPKVLVKTSYRYPDFSQCAKYDPTIYKFLTTVKTEPLNSPSNVAVLVTNLPVRELQVATLIDILYCYQLAVDTFKTTYLNKKEVPNE